MSSLLWRDSGRTVRFFGVDGRAAAGLVLVLAHVSLWTLGLSVSLILAFAILERFDYTLPNAARRARVFISGRKKTASNRLSLRRYRSG